MSETTPEKQSLIDSFLDETLPENKRVALLEELSKVDEESAIELISKTFQKKPTASFAKSLAAILPKMQSSSAYDLCVKYVSYLLKYDIERLPQHTELLVAALPILNEFRHPESTDLIISAYSRFRNEKQEQKAVVNSGVFQKLLSQDISEEQKIEILLILGDYDSLSTQKKNYDFNSAFGKMVKMHSDIKRIKKDLEFLKQCGDMELYKQVMDKVRSKLMPDILAKAALTGGIVVLIAFVIFFFLFIFGKNLATNQIMNKLTGFGISAFCTFVTVGTIILFRFKNK
jgi:hypothetical protein